MKEYLFRDVSVDIHIKDSKDNTITDINDKKYLDFCSGWCVGNIGWSKKVIIDAIRNFNGPTYVMPTSKYNKQEMLAKKLVSLMPNNNYTCFKTTGGTESVEVALKIARVYNKRKKFIAFKDAYHGQSFSNLCLTGTHESKFGPYPKDYIRIDISKNNFDWNKITKQVVSLINKKDICAFISEPIICNLGVVVPPKSFFKKIETACKKTKTVFIMDEVATGFGRTGKCFGFEHYNLKPDIITLAKGLSSGYLPIGAVVSRNEIAESMRFEFSNYSTFGWHPLSVEVTLENINYIIKNKLVNKSNNLGKYLIKKLSKFCNPIGKGLCVGFNVNNSNFVSDCLKDGLILFSFGNRVILFPSLDITKKEIDKAVRIIKKNF
ncbi:MAG: aspartate aminotransferase family protein [archaeon]